MGKYKDDLAKDIAEASRIYGKGWCVHILIKMRDTLIMRFLIGIDLTLCSALQEA